MVKIPELPEVETIKEDLKKKIVGKTIKNGWTDWPKIIKQPSAEQFFSEINGLTFTDVNRRAKILILHLNNGLFILVHLKMTGHFIVAPANLLKVDHFESDDPNLSDRQNQYIRFALFLTNGQVLAFSDLRRFGWVKLVTKEELENIISCFGPEPLSSDFTMEKFKEILTGRKGVIKTLLMDQTFVAGIGNIYADEILFKSHILPFREVKSLSDDEIKNLYSAIKDVLVLALKHRGTSTSDYRDTDGKKGTYGDIRNVYRRTGEQCPGCQMPVERKKIGGRSAHFCRLCQE